jgi:hypothetical protein
MKLLFLRRVFTNLDRFAIASPLLALPMSCGPAVIGALAASSGGGGGGGGGSPLPEVPDTTIDSGPGEKSSLDSATFVFSSTMASSFEGNLDEGGWLPVVSPHSVSGLTDGLHVFEIRSILDGVVDTSPASYEWTVDTTDPTAEFLFPPTDSLTDSSQVRLSGSASDALLGVSSVEVDGVRATSTDGFSSWTADVGLDFGPNQLNLRVEDVVGNVSSENGVILTRVGRALERPVAVTLGAAGSNSLLVINDLRNPWYLLSVDLSTGVRTVLFDAEDAGLGPSAGSDLSLDILNNRVIVATSRDLFGVDLSSGTLDLISGTDRGSGPQFHVVNSIVVCGSFAYVTHGFFNDAALLRVDLLTGDRTLVSSSARGQGPCFFAGQDIAVEPFANLAWVIDSFAILSVDLNSGDRVEVVSQPTIFSPTSIAPTTIGPGEDVFVTDSALAAVLSIDLQTGDGVIISNNGTGAGRELINPAGIELDRIRGRVIVSDARYDSIVSVDQLSGDRSVLSELSRGEGARLIDPLDVVLDAEHGELLVNDRFGGVVAVEMSDGDRRTVSAGFAYGIALDRAGRRLLAVVGDFDSRLEEIDLTTGNRTIISDANTGTGPLLDAPRRVAFCAQTQRAFVTDLGLDAVLEIDIATGNRREVSGPSRGNGQDLVFALGIVVTDTQQLFVGNNLSLLRIDIVTGDRTVVSGDGVGEGPPVVAPWSLKVDPTKSRAVIATTTSLISVDLASGDRRLITDASFTDGTFAGGTGVAVDWDSNVAMAVDAALGVALIDIATGTQLILSK